MKFVKITKIVIFLNVLLLLLQVAVASRFSGQGITFNKLSQQREDLEKQNLLLERKIASLSALSYLAEKAKANGFVKPQVIYLTSDYPVALNLKP